LRWCKIKDFNQAFLYHGFFKGEKINQNRSKAWTMPMHPFDRSWPIFTPFKLFFLHEKNAFWGVFGQKAWNIAHGLDQSWVIFTPFILFSVNLKAAKDMHFLPFLAKKHGL
jgi:hypothetical protein